MAPRIISNWPSTGAKPRSAVRIRSLPAIWWNWQPFANRRKDFDRALAILQRVVGIHTKKKGPWETSDVADDFSRIALVRAGQNKPEEEIPPLHTAIGIREKVLGADSPGLLSELDRLAQRRSRPGYESAETTFRRALVIREQIEGSQSPDLLTTLDGLAYSLYSAKRNMTKPRRSTNVCSTSGC